MRHIAALPDEKIPRDEEFNFRARAKNLVEKWHQILNANKPVPESPIEATGYPNGKPSDKVPDLVTQGAKIDLNGKGLSIFMDIIFRHLTWCCHDRQRLTSGRCEYCH
jgi:hypothetical protein